MLSRRRRRPPPPRDPWVRSEGEIRDAMHVAMRPDAANAAARDITVRAVEAGSTLVACPAGGVVAVLQILPRGNLEAVSPRALVLAALALALQGGDYGEAWRLAASQRLDLNILVGWRLAGGRWRLVVGRGVRGPLAHVHGAKAHFWPVCALPAAALGLGGPFARGLGSSSSSAAQPPGHLGPPAPPPHTYTRARSTSRAHMHLFSLARCVALHDRGGLAHMASPVHAYTLTPCPFLACATLLHTRVCVQVDLNWPAFLPHAAAFVAAVRKPQVGGALCVRVGTTSRPSPFRPSACFTLKQGHGRASGLPCTPCPSLQRHGIPLRGSRSKLQPLHGPRPSLCDVREVKPRTVPKP